MVPRREPPLDGHFGQLLPHDRFACARDRGFTLRDGEALGPAAAVGGRRDGVGVGGDEGGDAGGAAQRGGEDGGAAEGDAEEGGGAGDAQGVEECDDVGG